MTVYRWTTATSGDWSTAGLWSPAGPPNAATADAAISVAGTYAVTLDSGKSDTLDSLALSAAKATLDVNGALVFAGAQTLTVAAGTLALSGTIQAATISRTGGAISYIGGAFNAVTYRGLLDLSADAARLIVANGIILQNAAGSGAGSVDLAGNFSSLAVITSTTLNNATVAIGNNAQLELDISGGTLTLGPQLTLQQTGSGVAYLTDEFGNGSLVNLGTIIAGIAGDGFYVSGNSLSNQGVITVAAGAAFVDLATSFSNAGTVTVAAGATLSLEGAWSNTGQITANAAIVNLDGAFTAAQLATLGLSNDTVSIAGTLANAGATLAVGPGTSLGTVALASGGTITGGVIADSGSGLAFAGGTLFGVTYDGTIDLSPAGAYAFLAGALTLQGAAGTGRGAINLTGAGSDLFVATSMTLDNATISAGNNAYIQLYTDTGTLTLGAHLTVQQAGAGGATLDDAFGTGSLANLGTINATVAGDTFSVAGSSFRNGGLINVANGGGFHDGATSFSNVGTITVTAGSTLTLARGWSNAGTITATAATLDLYGQFTTAALATFALLNDTVNIFGTLVNTGATLVVGGSSSLGTLSVQTGGAIVGGVIDDSGGGLVLDGGTLNGVTYNTSATPVAVAAGATVTTTQLLAELAAAHQSNATVDVAGTVVNTGATLATGAGATVALLPLAATGVIIGGLVTDAGAGVAFTGGTLDGVTYQGTLNLTQANASVAIAVGLTLQGAGGTGPGAVNLTGSESTLAVTASTTLTNATITIGNEATLDLAAQDGTLTLGPGLTLQQAQGGVGTLYDGSGASGGGIVNAGTIIASASLTPLSLQGTSFTNQGLITVGAGGGLSVVTAGFSNTGTIRVAAGGTLTLEGAWQNTGTISATGATLDLYGSFTTATLASLTLSNDTVNIYGTLVNTTATLKIGAGTSLGTLTLEAGGTILGGVITDAGGGLVFNGGTLDGVTDQSTLNLGAAAAAVSVADGLTLQGAGGTGAGAVNLTGQGSTLSVSTSMTLDSATITIGNGAALDLAAPGGTLTLGPALAVQTAGRGLAYLNDGGGGGIVNAGTINDGLAAGNSLDIAGGSFTNLGLIENSKGDTISIQATTWTNLSGGTLTGGTYAVYASTVLELPNNATITTLDATIALTAAGSVIQSYNSGTATQVTLESMLTVIGASGVLRLLNARNYTTTNTLTDNGQLVLSLGTFVAAGTVAIGTTGTLFGAGVMAAPVANSGTIESHGGTLTLADPATGAGTLLVDAGSTLELAVRANAGTIVDNGTLKLDGNTYTAPSITVAAGGRIVRTGSITNVVANAGTIEANGGLLTLAGGASGAGTLQVDAGSKLVLAANTSAGTLTDNGLLLLQGATATVTTAVLSATGQAEGFGTFLNPLSDNGTIEAVGGVLKLGAVTGTGSLQIANAAHLELAGATSLNATFLSGAVGSLLLDAQASFTGIIQGLALGDALVFKNELVSSATLSGTTLAVVGSAGTVDYQVAGALAGNQFALGADHHTLTLTALGHA